MKHRRQKLTRSFPAKEHVDVVMCLYEFFFKSEDEFYRVYSNGVKAVKIPVENSLQVINGFMIKNYR